MRIFLTGATGFVGSYLVPELIGAGHQVLGLTRSDAGADALRAAGAAPHQGTLEDLGSIRSGAEDADGVIHCAFDHDFSRFAENCEKDRRVIETLGAVLAGSNRPLVVTSGVGFGSATPGAVATEDISNYDNPNPRTISEQTVDALAEKGLRVSVVRLPQVHDPYKQGLITYLVNTAREKGSVGYIGNGSNRFSAVHVVDAARLYRLALEKGEPKARYNAVAEEGVPARLISESLGRGLNLPVVSVPADKAAEHFGWMGMFAALDLPASGALTQQRLDWHPTGPTLLEDLDEGKFAIA